MTSDPRCRVGRERFSTVFSPVTMAHAHGWHTESAFMIDTFPCPKCGRTLKRSGEVSVEGADYPVFQCDECLIQTEMFGEPFEVALTFAVDAHGKPFDPAAPDGKLRL
jgi:hypothetical protein